MRDPYTLFKKYTLPNGLTLYHATWSEEKWQSLGFVVNVGARHDPLGMEGISHFIEHCVSQSTKEDMDKLSSVLSDRGGGMNLGITSHNNTTYTFSAPIKGPLFTKTLSAFGEMLVGLEKFQKVERERKIILSEFHRHFPLMSRFRLGLKLRHILYPGYWLERQLSPIGRRETILNFTEEDLKDFYNRFYIPENISVISLGGMTSADIMDALSKTHLIDPKVGEKTIRPEAIEPPKIETRRLITTFRKLYGKKMNLKSSEMLFVTTLHGKINIPTIRIAEEMLNHYLFDKIRQEHGLAYHVEIGRFRLISFSEFSIELEGVKKGTEKKIERIIDRSIEELLKNTELFERFRKKSASKDLIPDYSPFTIRRGAMSDVTYEGYITTMAHDRRQSASVKFEDVQEVFKALRPQNRLTSIITP